MKPKEEKMKLKTLNDAKEEAIKHICKNMGTEKDVLQQFGNLGLMTVGELVEAFFVDEKKEAIKWIKKLRKHKFYCVVCEKFDCDCGSSDFFKPRSEGVESWIKHNYNITEEDLK